MRVISEEENPILIHLKALQKKNCMVENLPRFPLLKKKDGNGHLPDKEIFILSTLLGSCRAVESPAVHSI